jgi:outer membrane lipoprotein-sorting protein
MFKQWFVILMMCWSLPAWSEAPTAAEIVANIDKNMVSDSRRSVITMTVTEPRGRVRSYQMETWGRGEKDSAITYLSPSRDKGTKMLKIGEELWIYLPSTEREQKISGHMLRRGMMGSDFSYEDMMESQELLKMYDSKVTGSEVVDGRDCWTMEMVAKEDGVTYPKRMAWIDKELYIMLKQELFALSGMKLKTWRMSDIAKIDENRHFPKTMKVEDHLRKGSTTTMVIENLTFGVALEDEIFSKRWLSRK